MPLFKKKEKVDYFETIEEEGGRTVQNCKLCGNYSSPKITNGKPEEMHFGLKRHLFLKHGVSHDELFKY